MVTFACHTSWYQCLLLKVFYFRFIPTKKSVFLLGKYLSRLIRWDLPDGHFSGPFNNYSSKIYIIFLGLLNHSCTGFDQRNVWGKNQHSWWWNCCLKTEGIINHIWNFSTQFSAIYSTCGWSLSGFKWSLIGDKILVDFWMYQIHQKSVRHPHPSLFGNVHILKDVVVIPTAP